MSFEWLFSNQWFLWISINTSYFELQQRLVNVSRYKYIESACNIDESSCMPWHVNCHPTQYLHIISQLSWHDLGIIESLTFVPMIHVVYELLGWFCSSKDIPQNRCFMEIDFLQWHRYQFKLILACRIYQWLLVMIFFSNRCPKFYT